MFNPLLQWAVYIHPDGLNQQCHVFVEYRYGGRVDISSDRKLIDSESQSASETIQFKEPPPDEHFGARRFMSGKNRFLILPVRIVISHRLCCENEMH